MLLANENESVNVITSCITEDYKEPFLQTICEAISSHHSEGNDVILGGNFKT